MNNVIGDKFENLFLLKNRLLCNCVVAIIRNLVANHFMSLCVDVIIFNYVIFHIFDCFSSFHSFVIHVCDFIEMKGDVCKPCLHVS